MIETTNVNCYLYRSDTDASDFKFLDYNCTDCNIDAYPQFEDMRRNGNTVCGGIVYDTPVWAIWSSAAVQCY